MQEVQEADSVESEVLETEQQDLVVQRIMAIRPEKAQRFPTASPPGDRPLPERLFSPVPPEPCNSLGEMA